jgi:integrase
MFRFAVEREIVPRHPLEGIKKANIGGKDAERDRILSDEEIQALRDAVPRAKMHPRSALAIWLLLSTAARVGEAMAACWEHIDLDRATWYLPETKNQRDHTIHLSAFALRQFRALAALRESIRDDNGNERPVSWVFPNSARNGPVCAKSFGKQLADRQRLGGERLKNRTKSEDSLVLQGGKWTAHDLRRTAATIMAKLDVSTDVIDECLNHKLRSKVARVYIRDRREVAQRIAFDALGAHLDALVNRPPVSNVMPFATRAASRAQSLIADAVLVTTANAL